MYIHAQREAIAMCVCMNTQNSATIRAGAIKFIGYIPYYSTQFGIIFELVYFKKLQLQAYICMYFYILMSFRHFLAFSC